MFLAKMESHHIPLRYCIMISLCHPQKEKPRREYRIIDSYGIPPLLLVVHSILFHQFLSSVGLVEGCSVMFSIPVKCRCLQLFP